MLGPFRSFDPSKGKIRCEYSDEYLKEQNWNVEIQNDLHSACLIVLIVKMWRTSCLCVWISLGIFSWHTFSIHMLTISIFLRKPIVTFKKTVRKNKTDAVYHNIPKIKKITRLFIIDLNWTSSQMASFIKLITHILILNSQKCRIAVRIIIIIITALMLDNKALYLSVILS